MNDTQVVQLRLTVSELKEDFKRMLKEKKMGEQDNANAHLV